MLSENGKKVDYQVNQTHNIDCLYYEPILQYIIMMADYPAVKQLLADIEHPAKAKFVAEDIQRHT